METKNNEAAPVASAEPVKGDDACKVCSGYGGYGDGPDTHECSICNGTGRVAQAAPAPADEEGDPPQRFTREQVLELLDGDLLIDSGVRTLRDGDQLLFSLEELTLLANLAARAAPAPEAAAPVAYLHQVVSGDGEPDQALSFAPDNFPLAGTLGYRSLSHQPLFTAPVASQPAQSEQQRCERENAEFTEWWNREQACPEHSLVTENAAHAAWQERGRRASQPAGGE